MQLWTPEVYDQLADAQKRAVARRVPTPAEGEEAMTPANYLNAMGAGLTVVDAYVEADRSEFKSALAAAADALFDAGVTPEEIHALALGFAAADESVRAQAVTLLTPAS